MTNGIAGMKADPSCRRHAILPTLKRARFALDPKKMPKAVHLEKTVVTSVSVSWYGCQLHIPHRLLIPCVTELLIFVTHSCHDMTNPPRTSAGAFSAENTGTVTSFKPMPTPRRIRQTTLNRRVEESASALQV